MSNSEWFTADNNDDMNDDRSLVYYVGAVRIID